MRKFELLPYRNSSPEPAAHHDAELFPKKDLTCLYFGFVWLSYVFVYYIQETTNTSSNQKKNMSGEMSNGQCQ